MPALDAEALISGEATEPTMLGGPLGSGGGPDVAPANIVIGSCGESWVFMYDVGVREYQVQTGFRTNQPSVGYTWMTNVIQPASAYNHNHRWHGALAMNLVFSMQATATVRTGGWATAKATGYSVLWNGLLCQSLGPIDSEAIY